MGCAAAIQLEHEVADALEAGRLRLPSLPDLALKVNELTQSERGTATQVATAISRDPALSARLVQAANSAASGSRVKVQSLPAAITRLGLHYTRALVNRLVVEQMFFTRQPALAELMRQTWARSLEVAALAETLAAHRTPLRPEVAMLAGLMHRIGMLPLIRQLEMNPDAAGPRQGWIPMMERLHPSIGARVLRHWGFSSQLQEVPIASDDPLRDVRGPADYTDLVIVARLQFEAYPADAMLAARQHPEAVPALGKLGIAADCPVLSLPTIDAGYTQAMARLQA